MQVVSAGIVRAACSRLNKVGYLKPLQTGTAQGDSDVGMVEKYLGGNDLRQKLAIDELYSWPEPLSPHVTAEAAGNAPTDGDFREAVEGYLRGNQTDLTLIETAGGVLSPAASRTLQADLYALVGLDAILVADGRLGGISTTLASLEALERRKFKVRAIAVLEEDQVLGNVDFLAGYWQSGSVVRFSNVPEDKSVPLDDWFTANEGAFSQFLTHLLE